MRRVVPWALVGLVVVGAGLGAALGAAAPGPPGVTPSQWVADLLATTAASGSARFAYTHVSTSASVAYSGRLVGSGEVDFRSETVRATEVDHQTEFTSGASGLTRPEPMVIRLEFVGIGSAMYQSLAPAGFGPLPWTRLSLPRDPSLELGLSLVGNASIALDELGGARRVVGVRAVGPATVGGVATTRYEVSTAPVCRPLHPSTVRETQGPSFVWVDAGGRLVQVRGSLHLGGHLPAALRARFPSLGLSGGVTTTDTLRLTDFALPVHIEPPPHALIHHGSGGLIVSHLTCRS